MTGFRWAARPGRRDGGMVTRSWTDPCPVCGSEVVSLEGEAITIRDNPDAVLTVHDPYCPWDEDDPDSPDCTCTVIINPAPNPLLDEEHIVGWTYTLHPCGHQTSRNRRFYTQTVPAPGTLGEFMAEWAAAADEDP